MPRKPTKKAKAPAPAKRKGPGRPSDWKPEYVEQARKLAGMGHTHLEIARFFEVEDRTFRRWMHKYPELREALLIPEEQANRQVILSLYKQAVGYEREEEEIKVVKGKIVRMKVLRYYPPSTSAGIFWAKSKAGLRDDTPIDPSGPLDPNPGDEAPATEQEPPKQVARRILYLINKGDYEENAA